VSEAIRPAQFLAKKGYAWRNFHDGNWEIEKLVGRSGIPRTMLVDAQGKIAYDAERMDEIAKLGPEYAPLLPIAWEFGSGFLVLH
jgi:hypothetical protein